MTISPPQSFDPEPDAEPRRSLGSLLAEHLAELEAERAAVEEAAHFDDVVYGSMKPDADDDEPDDHVTALPPVVPLGAPPSTPLVLPRRPAESVAELADRLGDDVVDAADVVAEIGQHGVNDDEEARRRYGMSLHGVGVSVLDHLETRRAQKGLRRAPAKRPYLLAALLRCALYLGPLSVAVAAAPALHPLHPLVPAVILLLGWSAAQALTSVGAVVARQAGPAPAARLVGGGFLAAGGVWGGRVWIAPAAILGGQRM
ncbi:hypothetical protein AB0M20_17825, partial [Actinoplanes sp. NPDC051633]